MVPFIYYLLRTILNSYFSTGERGILDFIDNKKQTMMSLVFNGKVVVKTGDVVHNDAPLPAVLRLYGINKWANENNIDLVVHVHFNDYPRKNRTVSGKYSGFVIYTPEKQYSNSRASNAVAVEVSKQLKTHYVESNMPREVVGVVENQDLIAIGSFNTLDPASILIEYGYIYESQFADADMRNEIITDMAAQTYLGIHNFFDNNSLSVVGKFNTTLLPYIWSNVVRSGVKNSESILALQTAMVSEGLYPPDSLDPHDCPLSGTYGLCTRTSLSLFQQKYNLKNTSGILNTQTLEKFNELYGS